MNFKAIMEEEKNSDELGNLSKMADDAFERITNSAHQVHSLAIEGAQFSGFVVDAFPHLRARIDNFMPLADKNPYAFKVIESGINQLNALGQELHHAYTDLKPSVNKLGNVAGTVFTYGVNTDTDASFLDVDINNSPFNDTPPFLVSDEESIINIFARLDPSLGELYKEVWQAYYGTDVDNVRAALGLMRQTYDHFFHILAPDNKVRESKFWKEKKEEENPKQVFRRERINYTIHSHVSDENRATSLAANMDSMLDT